LLGETHAVSACSITFGWRRWCRNNLSFACFVARERQRPVRLLKDVTVMESLSDPQNPNSGRGGAGHRFSCAFAGISGVATRFGKRVAYAMDRLFSIFPELHCPAGGSTGVGCIGAVNLPADHATNPFKHRIIPNTEGFDIARQITFKFDGSPGADCKMRPVTAFRR